VGVCRGVGGGWGGPGAPGRPRPSPPVPARHAHLKARLGDRLRHVPAELEQHEVQARQQRHRVAEPKPGAAAEGGAGGGTCVARPCRDGSKAPVWHPRLASPPRLPLRPRLAAGTRLTRRRRWARHISAPSVLARAAPRFPPGPPSWRDAGGWVGLGPGRRAELGRGSGSKGSKVTRHPRLRRRILAGPLVRA
jgi:hypothetical protein